MRRQQHPRAQLDQPMQRRQRPLGCVRAVERQVHPPDVVVRQRVPHDQELLVGLPQRQVARRVARRCHDLPLRLAQPHDLPVSQRLVDRVGRHGLIQVLSLATPRIPPGHTLRVPTAGGDPHPGGLQQPVPADMVGVPMGVHHQREVPRLHLDPISRLLGVPDETAVDQSRLPTAQQEQVGVRERSALPHHPRREHATTHASPFLVPAGSCLPTGTRPRTTGSARTRTAQRSGEGRQGRRPPPGTPRGQPDRPAGGKAGRRALPPTNRPARRRARKNARVVCAEYAPKFGPITAGGARTHGQRARRAVAELPLKGSRCGFDPPGAPLLTCPDLR